MAIVVLIGSFGCGGHVFAQAPGTVPPVLIGAVFALSGIAAEDNKPAVGAVQLAVEEINRRGGLLDRPVELRVFDNQSSPLASKAAAERAVAAGVVAVIGAVWSSHSLPMARVLQDAGTPMITPVSTKPEVTRVGDYIFRVCFTDAFQGEAMAQFAFHDLGFQTAYIAENINEEYSVTLAHHFQQAFTGLGGKLLGKGHYKGTAVDFTELVDQIRALKPAVVFVPGYARDSGLFIRQAVRMGISARFFGGDGWSDQMYAYGGQEIDGSYYSTHWHQQVAFKESEELKALYRSKFSDYEITDARIPLSFDAVMLLADAVRRAGNFERHKIREALARTRGFPGACGPITYDANGDPVGKSLSIIRFSEGGSVFIKSFAPRISSPNPDHKPRS